jgi:hypothetical protein
MEEGLACKRETSSFYGSSGHKLSGLITELFSLWAFYLFLEFPSLQLHADTLFGEW